MRHLIKHLTPTSQPSRALFILLSWLHMLSVTQSFFLASTTPAGFDVATLFNVLAWFNYSLLYLLPGLLPYLLLQRFFPQWQKLLAGLAIVGTSSCILFIHTDRVIYDLYNFHFNNFVVNLIMTPGGIESLGGGTDTYVSVTLTALGHILAQGIFWLISSIPPLKRRQALSLGMASFVVVTPMLGERLIYGMGEISNNGAILEQAKAYPFYKRTTFRSLAAKFGITPAERQASVMAEVGGNKLAYPTEPVQFSAVDRPLNVILLVAESLRWDRLNAEVMPNSWAFAGRSQHFLNHYSSGNGTREGLFGLFYGLYGSYWSSFLYSQKSPLLMDRFQELGYQFNLRTSARFSYPEFNQTMFARIPLADQHEADGSKPAWQRDADNTTALIDFFKTRDKNKPFMSFVFFESTHARYDFPDSAAIAKPYLESVNYGSMSRASLRPKIDQLFNRYTNAAHWIDQQLGRIYTALDEQKLLDNTIVIVTGDHGEEFMEKGFWGHNSSFVDEQVRTPMIVWYPGKGHRQIEALSSHLDVPTTLLQALGAPADSSSYSLGHNLFNLPQSRYLVSSDWHSIGLIHPEMKYRISYDNRGTDSWAPTRPDDSALDSAAARELLVRQQTTIMDAMRNAKRFTRKG